ncbi:MAG: LLM class F420-dependent oxidoreductase [Dehalococcoidia bacterium]
MRRFRFGVSVGEAGSRAEWAAKARRAEDLGFDTLLTADHLDATLPPLQPLITAAEATNRLRVGTLVLNNDFRHPVLVAREAAALDLLSDGRFELGLGAGHMKPEYDEAGMDFDPPATRIERLGEAVRIIKGLLDGETVSFSARHYQVAGHTGHPPPVQRPHPPILIGGNSRETLSLAGREAEIAGLTGFGHTREGKVVLSGFTAAATEQRISWVREAAGERFDVIELNALVQRVVVTENRQEAAAELAARIPRLTPEQALESPYLLIGTVAQLIDDLHARRERLGISYCVVFEPALDALAPVVARLAGQT